MDEAARAGEGPAQWPGPAHPPRPGRRWSRALVGLAVLGTALVVAAQMLATFFYNAPSSVVSKTYAAQISWWMNPLLNQDWQLFAPNPFSENVEVDARASVGQSGAVSPWLDLSAIDAAGTTDNPVPSHLTMNAMRNAWREYATTHGSNGLSDSPLGATAQQYLESFVLTYLRPRESGTIDSIQIRFIVTLIPGPGRTAAQTAPQTQALAWWVVTAP